MSGISLDRLKELAQTYRTTEVDTELRLEGGKDGGRIEEREGKLGSRMARSLKIAFSDEDRSVKQEQYMGAKDAVLQTLIQNYGIEIGTKAFRAGVGHTTSDGTFETSSDHPISSRHIDTMLKEADRLVDHVEIGRWMDRTFDEVEGDGTRQVTFGDSISRETGRMSLKQAFDAMGGDITADANDKFNQLNDEDLLHAGNRHAFWLVKVETKNGDVASIALHMNREDRGHVELLNKDGTTRTVPLGELGDRLRSIYGSWLDDVRSVSVHRAEQELLGDDVIVDNLEVRRDFNPEELTFSPSDDHGGTEIVPLTRMFTDQQLDEIDEAYEDLFGKQELRATRAQEHLSPGLRERLDERGQDLKIIDPEAGELSLLDGDTEQGVSERLKVDIPPSNNDPDGGARRLDAEERKFLSRFLNDKPFLDLYHATCRAMKVDEGELGVDPIVFLDITARRDENDEVMIDVQFQSDLPDRLGGDQLELNYKLTVPLSEIRSENPDIDFETPWLERLEDDGVLGDFDPDQLEFEETGEGTETVDLNQIFTGAYLDEVDEAYEGRFSEQELEGTNQNGYLSPGFLVRVHQRGADLKIVDPEYGERSLVDGNDAEGMNENLRVVIPPSRDNPDGVGLNLGSEGRKLISRFLDDTAFVDLYKSTCHALDLEGEEEPVVSVQIEAQRDENDRSVFQVTFRASLPETPGNPALTLEYDITVAEDEIGLEHPEITFGMPLLVRRQQDLGEILDDLELVNDGGEQVRPVEVRDVLRQIEDLDVIRNGVRTRLGEDVQWCGGGRNVPQDIMTRQFAMNTAGQKMSIRIDVNDRGFEDVTQFAPTLPQLGVLEGSNGQKWELDQAQRSNLGSLIGGKAFDDMFGQIVGDGPQPANLTVKLSTSARDNGEGPDITLTFRAPMPEGGDLVMTMRTTYDELRKTTEVPGFEITGLTTENPVD